LPLSAHLTSEGVNIVSNSRPQGRQDSGDKVFDGLPVGPGEADRFSEYLAAGYSSASGSGPGNGQ
jgi:hypothetical protein